VGVPRAGEPLFSPELAAAIEALDDPAKPIDLYAVGGAFQVVRATFSADDPRNYEAWLQTIPFNLSIESEGQEPFHSYFGPISSTTYEDGTVRYAPDPREADARALVARFSQIAGYRCLSLIRAFGVVKCQLALA
jgi:hypothetical protein